MNQKTTWKPSNNMYTEHTDNNTNKIQNNSKFYNKRKSGKCERRGKKEWKNPESQNLFSIQNIKEQVIFKIKIPTQIKRSLFFRLSKQKRAAPKLDKK